MGCDFPKRLPLPRRERGFSPENGGLTPQVFWRLTLCSRLVYQEARRKEDGLLYAEMTQCTSARVGGLRSPKRPDNTSLVAQHTTAVRLAQTRCWQPSAAAFHRGLDVAPTARQTNAPMRKRYEPCFDQRRIARPFWTSSANGYPRWMSSTRTRLFFFGTAELVTTSSPTSGNHRWRRSCRPRHHVAIPSNRFWNSIGRTDWLASFAWPLRDLTPSWRRSGRHRRRSPHFISHYAASYVKKLDESPGKRMNR